MGQPGAKQGDRVTAMDVHIVMIPSPGGPVPTPLPHPFNGIIGGGLSANVKIMGRAAAIVGSTADNMPPHIPQGGPFQRPPSNTARLIVGSPTVHINGKPVVRNGDTALTCNDPVDLPVGTVVAIGTVTVA